MKILYLKECLNSKNVVVIPPVLNKMELLTALSINLGFPKYFGFNWDALEELFSDLNWCRMKQLIIYHENVSSLPIKELETYLDILTKSIYFRNHIDYSITIAFNYKEKQLIDKIVGII